MYLKYANYYLIKIIIKISHWNHLLPLVRVVTIVRINYMLVINII